MLQSRWINSSCSLGIPFLAEFESKQGTLDTRGHIYLYEHGTLARLFDKQIAVVLVLP